MTTTPSDFAHTAAQLKARRKQRTRLHHLAAYSVLILIALIMLYPFYWTLITSLEPTGNIYQAKLAPSGVSFKNYAAVLSGTTVPFWRMVLNSVVICTVGVLGSVTFAALAAYPLAKMRFPGRDLIFYAILALVVLPNESGLIVNYITTIKLGLLEQRGPVWDTLTQYAAIVLPSIASIVGLFLIRQAYLGVPLELIEAARIDGAKELTIWRQASCCRSRCRPSRPSPFWNSWRCGTAFCGRAFCRSIRRCCRSRRACWNSPAPSAPTAGPPWRARCWSSSRF